MVAGTHRFFIAGVILTSSLFVLYTVYKWNINNDFLMEPARLGGSFQKLRCPVLRFAEPPPMMPKVNDPPNIIQNCPNQPKNLIDTAFEKKYITCNFGATGGLGNQIWRFASLYGLGRYTGREPFFEARHGEQMGNIPEISLIFPMMTEVLQIKNPAEILLKKLHFADDCCKFDDPKKLIAIPNKYVKVAGDYLQSYKFFHNFREEIRSIFECGPNIRTPMDAFAKDLFKNDNSHRLCAHIRRGDFIGDLMLESKEDFTVPAINYAFKYLKEITNNSDISMVFIGSDQDFMKNLSIKDVGFKNIYIPNPRPRGEDMCFGINYCDSMVMTASGSTFGWWISYLMKPGSPIFYNSQVSDNGDFTKDIHDFDIFPPEWIMLTVQNGTAKKETQWWHQRRNQTADLPGKDLTDWF
ncbi:hypothetical protein FO519_007073 [Halicephalobus sp. NKZ332]|nr:hypothetical protein FO519_007073 [Halicephalobus sp. NKZ332]